MTEGQAVVPVTDPRPVDQPWPAMTWPLPAGLVLRGRHVVLRGADPATDGEVLFAALADPGLWAHIPRRPADAVDCTRLLQDMADDPTWHCWVVESAGRVVGMTSYLEAASDHARLEIGFTVYRRDVWGTAVNPECKLLLLALAFDTLLAGRVQLKTDIRNERSQRAIARLGARYEGVLRRYQRRHDGSMRDTVLFSVTAEDWPGVRAGLQDRVSA